MTRVTLPKLPPGFCWCSFLHWKLQAAILTDLFPPAYFHVNDIKHVFAVRDAFATYATFADTVLHHPVPDRRKLVGLHSANGFLGSIMNKTQ
jgi:hypothetical protein